MKLYGFVAMHQGAVYSVRVFDHESSRDKAREEAIKEKFGSVEEYQDMLEHALPSYEFPDFESELEVEF